MVVGMIEVGGIVVCGAGIRVSNEKALVGHLAVTSVASAEGSVGVEVNATWNKKFIPIGI